MSDIAEIMARDPLQCSDQDISLVIAEFRSKKHLFTQGNLMAGRTKPVKLTKEQEAAKELVGKLDLGDL